MKNLKDNSKKVLVTLKGNILYYHFRQNNSGGWFTRDDSVNENVIIAATSAQEANDFAEEIGIYFNGCNTGRDCSCCGDRWSPCLKDEGKKEPSIYNKYIDYSTLNDPKGNTYLYRYNSKEKEVYYTA